MTTPVSVRTKCPQCTLEMSFVEGETAACPNCDIPMQPIGERDVMAAEQAFAEAQRELAPPPAPTKSAPAEETTVTLTARLREIDSARRELEASKADYAYAKEKAADAKKVFDGKVESFLSLCRRLASVETALPLFTPAAEAAAVGSEAPPVDLLVLGQGLVEAGVHVDAQALEALTPDQHREAQRWASADGTVAGMPAFLQALMADDDLEALLSAQTDADQGTADTQSVVDAAP